MSTGAEECIRCGERYDDHQEPCPKGATAQVPYHIARRNASPFPSKRRCNATPDGKVFCECELGHKGPHQGIDSGGVLGPPGAPWTSGVCLVGGPPSPPEAVNHPKHYNAHPSGVECIAIIEHMTFNVGSAIKYLWRAGLKDSEPTLTDLKKAAWYIAREIERIEKR